MVNYQNGKVYKLVCNKTGLVYVGSTTLALSVRKAGHTRSYKSWKEGKCHYVTSFLVLEAGDYDVVLLELCPCETKEQLHAKERQWIETLDCVNKVVPTRTPVEWYQVNKQRFVEYYRNYYRVYREVNRDKINEYVKQYREANRGKVRECVRRCKEARREKLRARHECPCGGSYTLNDKARHLKTNKHQNWQKEQQL